MNVSAQRERVKNLLSALARNGYDAIIFLDPNCHRTFTGSWQVTTADPVEACILPVYHQPVLIVHSNTKQIVAEETWIRDIRERAPFPLSISKPYETQTLSKAIAGVLSEFEPSKKKIAVDENRTSLSIIRAVENESKDVKFEGVSSLLDTVLGVRSEEEIRLLRRATSIADAGMRVALDTVRPGRRECDVAAECARVMFKEGADRLWFPLTVNSGTRSGIPYAYASEKEIENRDVVQLDFGPVYLGCYADLSRIAYAGEGNREQRKIYETVLRAHEAAIATIMPGVTAGEIDRASRKIIDAAGFGDYSTTHHTGHPVGFIYGPEIEPTSKAIIKEGMTFTIEPGIYIPSVHGIRIEDDVLVTKEGCEILTRVERAAA